jgi:hypothetical protein
MKKEAKAIDFWALIAVLVLGVIFGTCVLSAFGLEPVGGRAADRVSGNQFQDPPAQSY